MEYILATLGIAAIVYFVMAARGKKKNPPGFGGGQSGNKNQPK